MKKARAKWTDAEFEVLLKVYDGDSLSRKDHITLEKMYAAHGANSVYLAMANLSGKLPHINKNFEEKAKSRASHKPSATHRQQINNIRERVRASIASVEAGDFFEFETCEELREFANAIKEQGRKRLSQKGISQ